MFGDRTHASRGKRRPARPRRRGAPPLPRRRTDHAEDLVAWLLTSVGLLAVLGAVLVGQAAHHAALGPAADVTAERSAEAWAFGISAGLTVVALTWALLTLVWSAVRRVTTACNAARWAREWARVEPGWRRSIR